MEKDCISYSLLEELRQRIRDKFNVKTDIVTDFVAGLTSTLPEHVRRRGFSYLDPFGEEFTRQVHLRPTNGSEKLKNKMECMWVTKIVTEKLEVFTEK